MQTGDGGLQVKPLAIDLFCGLGGWTDGLLAEGWDVVGFDIERHHYGDAKYPAQLVVQDALTLHGSQFRQAGLIVASPPCQEFSYMAMPWSRAKQIRRALRGEDDFPEGYTGSRTKAELTALFDACFRLQREACQTAGKHIPLVVENVRGANEWVGRSRWNFGSFHLWGDIPALMPPISQRRLKYQSSASERMWRDRETPRLNDAIKNTGGSWFNVAHNTNSGKGRNPVHELAGIKGSEGYERDHPEAFGWAKPGTSSHSKARKAASAMIAKIPLPLSRHIAAVFKPRASDAGRAA